MKKGFFSTSQLSSVKSQSTIPRCGLCGLHRTCLTPRMKPTGKGKRGILFIAEAPGKEEDKKGIQLIGEAGQYLRKVLRSCNVDLEEDSWKTNAIICRPPGNATPTDDMIRACRPNVIKAVKKFNPTTIVLLGKTAVESVIPALWKDRIENLDQWVGWDIPSQEYNAWICPTYHPAFLIRNPGIIYERLFKQHIRRAVKHTRRPWKEVPKWQDEVDVIYRPSDAALRLRDTLKGSSFTWDLEANCLKPETEGSEIISCAVCDDKGTFAFPWTGVTLDVMAKLLKSSRIKKIAANVKFEHRWILRKCQFAVKGWYFDTMLGAHVLDNRPKITSVKFQSFVLLGQPSYNDQIEPYLKSKGKVGLNRIRQLDLKDVLVYNGMDAKVEEEIAKVQIKQLERQIR